MTHYLDFHQHTSEAALKANHVLACTKIAFVGLSELYDEATQGNGETNNGVCKHYLGFTLSVIYKRRVKRVQHHTIMLAPSLSDKSYQHCLITQTLQTLAI